MKDQASKLRKMVSGHTLGPWEVKKTPHDTWKVLAFVGKTKAPILIMETTKEANARLIAATPDLLEVLEDTVCDLQFSEIPTHINSVKKARTVIAKATKKG